MLVHETMLVLRNKVFSKQFIGISGRIVGIIRTIGGKVPLFIVKTDEKTD